MHLRNVRPLFVSMVLLSIGCPGRPPTEYQPVPDDVPSALTALVCHETFDCCDETPFSSFGGCEQPVRQKVAVSVAAAIDAGLAFSSDCGGRLFAEKPESAMCVFDVAAASFLPCNDDCQLFFGDQALGEECNAIGYRMSDCQQGLICGPDRTCHSPCEVPNVAPEGGFCGAGRGMWFVTCEPGTTCSYDGTCVSAQLIGVSCDSSTPCEVGSWCDSSTDTCAADLAGGSSCSRHSQCLSYICKDGACFEPESPECGRWGW